MTVLLIILAILVLILVIPLGVKLGYGDGVFSLAARVLCFNIRILPKKEKPPAAEKKPKKHREKKPKKPKKRRPEDEEEKKKEKLTPQELLQLAKLGLSALSRFRRKLTVNEFRLHFTAADPDPYRSAMLYGYANAALESLEPLAKKAFRVRQSDVQTAVSFETEQPEIDFGLTVTISLGRILGALIPVGIAFMKLKKAKKKEQDRAAGAEERTDKDGTADAAAQPDGGTDAGEHGQDQADGGC